MINKEPKRPNAILCLKAFGDLIIARRAVRDLVSSQESVRMIIGDHLEALNTVLGAQTMTISLPHCEGGVPAFYDARKQGVVNALRSGARLRSLLSAVEMPIGSSVLLDHTGLRERYIAADKSIQGLPVANNIYEAYALALNGSFVEPTLTSIEANFGRTVGIFPGSRVQRKVIPASVISRLTNVCRAADLRSVIYILDGEQIELPQHCEKVVVVDRRFDAMAQAINEVDAVLSADSMPAHMADFYRKPVFVISPTVNQYWLPISAFHNQRWSLFDQTHSCEERLNRFLCVFFSK